MKYEHEKHRTRDYREVLLKLQESAEQALSRHARVTHAEHDGIRYDYDDSSELM